MWKTQTPETDFTPQVKPHLTRLGFKKLSIFLSTHCLV